MSESTIFWAVLITALILGGLILVGAMILSEINRAEQEEENDLRAGLED